MVLPFNDGFVDKDCLHAWHYISITWLAVYFSILITHYACLGEATSTVCCKHHISRLYLEQYRVGFPSNRSDMSHHIYHRVKASIHCYFPYNFRRIYSLCTMLNHYLRPKPIFLFFFWSSCVIFCLFFCDFLSCLYWESHQSFQRYAHFPYYYLGRFNGSFKPLLIITNNINICINSHIFIKGQTSTKQETCHHKQTQNK